MWKLSIQKFLKYCQTPREELSLPWCPALALSTSAGFEAALQCERKSDCSNTVVFHITNTSLQTEAKFRQPLEFTLLHGLDLPGPGEGVPSRNVWNWRLEKKNMLVEQCILLFWVVIWMKVISQGIWLCTWSRTNSRGLIFVSEVKDLAMSRGGAARGGCRG